MPQQSGAVALQMLLPRHHPTHRAITPVAHLKHRHNDPSQRGPPAGRLVSWLAGLLGSVRAACAAGRRAAASAPAPESSAGGVAVSRGVTTLEPRKPRLPYLALCRGEAALPPRLLYLMLRRGCVVQTLH